MNTKHWLIGTLAAAALALGLALPAEAGSVMCEPVAAATGPQAGTFGGTNSAVPSQTLYILNSIGCAVIASGDVGYARSQGWAPGPNLFTVQFGPITAQSTAANSPILPVGAALIGLEVTETTGNAITGGLDVGVAGSSNATIASAVAVGASNTVYITPITGYVIATTGLQVWFNAHTNWSDAASIKGTIFYSLTSPY
jgi:hypothetical protein